MKKRQSLPARFETEVHNAIRSLEPVPFEDAMEIDVVNYEDDPAKNFEMQLIESAGEVKRKSRGRKMTKEETVVIDQLEDFSSTGI